MLQVTKQFLPQAQLIAGVFTGHGLSLAQACGMVAQAQGESAFNAKAVGDKGQDGKPHAFGAFQLHPDRIALIKHGCGIDLAAFPALDQQAEGVWYELTHSEQRALRYIRACADAFDAGQTACRYYERPASPLDWAKRGGFAQAWFQALSAP